MCQVFFRIGWLVVGLGLVAGDPPRQVRMGDVLLTETTVRNVTVLRGTHEVFEDREAMTGRKIALDIIVAPATGDDPAPDPIFTFAGGPGAAATDWAGSLGDLAFVREARDIVLVAQRGTGQSNGLFCRQPGDPDLLATYLDEMYAEDYVRACRDALAQRADLRLYTTAIAMADLNEVRAALGYEKINLFGVSYGGRAVLTYLRRHEATVRTAVAEFPSPPWQAIPSEFAIDAQAALEKLIADCAADTDCAARFPDLGTTVAKAFAHFADGPVPVTLTNPMTGKPETVTLKHGVVATIIRSWLYNPESSAYLPLLLEATAEGAFADMVLLAAAYTKAMDSFLADGMYLSVTCAEDIPYFDARKWRDASRDTFLKDYRIRTQVRGCGLWPRGEIPASFREPLKSKVPVLLVSGDLDPVTPPRWSEQIAKGLANAAHLRFPKAAHGGEEIYWCYDPILAAFLEKGSAEGIDLSCAAEVTRPPFESERSDLGDFVAQRTRRVLTRAE